MTHGRQNIDNAVTLSTSNDKTGVVIVKFSELLDEMIQAINYLKRTRSELITISLAEEHDEKNAFDHLLTMARLLKVSIKLVIE